MAPFKADCSSPVIAIAGGTKPKNEAEETIALGLPKLETELYFWGDPQMLR